MKKRGQSWSIDLLTALVVFIFIVILIYSFTRGRENNNSLEGNAKYISSQLEKGNVAVFGKSKLNLEELNSLCAMDYNTLKKTLGIEKDVDFCIFLTFTDDNGVKRLFFINDKTGCGSMELNLTSDISQYGKLSCGTTVP